MVNYGFSKPNECQRFVPRIVISTKQPKVKYITNLSRENFVKESPHKVSPNTLGLTVVEMDNTSFITVPQVKRMGKKLCVGIKEVKFHLGIKSIKVFIDKKYKKNTCEYRVIKRHEDYHVAVSKQALEFYRPDIEKLLKKTVRQLIPEIAYNNEEAQKIIDTQSKKIYDALQPAIKHISEKIAEKNYEIDTPESYKATTKLCKNW